MIGEPVNNSRDELDKYSKYRQEELRTCDGDEGPTIEEVVIPAVAPSRNVSKLELKQGLESTALQSKKPFIIVTVSGSDENGFDPIPGYGDEALTSKKPFTIRMTSVEDVGDRRPGKTTPDPIPAPCDPFALIYPPEIVNAKTMELPGM
jgi:hypothetical protein